MSEGLREKDESDRQREAVEAFILRLDANDLLKLHIPDSLARIRKLAVGLLNACGLQPPDTIAALLSKLERRVPILTAAEFTAAFDEKQGIAMDLCALGEAEGPTTEQGRLLHTRLDALNVQLGFIPPSKMSRFSF